MNIIRNPSVYILGYQKINYEVLNEFIQNECDGEFNVPLQNKHTEEENLIEIAGRLCYMSFNSPRPGGSPAYFENILEQGHGSVLEHGVFSIVMTGVSRSLTHELVRHRAGWGYSQLSQRYVDESVPNYVMPEEVQQSHEKVQEDWINSIEKAHFAYVDLVHTLIRQIKGGCSSCYVDFSDSTKSTIKKTPNRISCQCGAQCKIDTDDLKKARQAARSVLPNATETKIFCTVNARALRHFLELRGSLQAEKEIRKLAIHLLTKLRNSKMGGLIFKDFQLKIDEKTGYTYIHSEHKKA